MIRKLSYIVAKGNDPYYNLALEEMLLENVEKDQCILYLWQNKNTIVIGRNQNIWNECKIDLLEQSGGHVVRRLSGGGAVFHDLGNLNFTFLVHKDNYSVEKQLGVIIEALKKFGLNAEKNGRNDVTIDGRKFSGNAFFESGDNCYHHGTLMVNVNIEDLSKYLNVSKEKLKSKGVKSVKSRVINLSSLSEDLTVDSLKEKLIEAFGQVYKLTPQSISYDDMDEKLMQKKMEKFKSWKWTYGRKIDFKHEFKKRFEWGDVDIQLNIKRGIIEEVVFNSDAMEQDTIINAAKFISKTIFRKKDICEKLLHYKCRNNKEEKIINDVIKLIDEQVI